MKHNSLLKILIVMSMHVATSCKTILVTGGAGFIGGHVVEHLLNRGDKVIAIDNFSITGHESSDNYKALKTYRINQLLHNNNLTFYNVDIKNAAALEDVVKNHQIDVICHLAARAGVRPSVEDPAEYMQVNIVATIHILELAKKYNIPHVVLASSSSVYGNQEQGPFFEIQNTDAQTSPYGASKKALELIAYVYYHLYNISCSCLRFFTVYGPYGRFDMAPFIFLDAIYNEQPITVVGDGSAVRDFTYVDDIVNGIIKAIDKPAAFQVFNLGCSDPVILHDFINIIESVVGKKAILLYEPASLADVQLTHANVDKAYEILGYVPSVTVQEGMRRTYEWYQNIYLPTISRNKGKVA